MIDLPEELVSRVECNDGSEHAMEDRRTLYLLTKTLAARLAEKTEGCRDLMEELTTIALQLQAAEARLAEAMDKIRVQGEQYMEMYQLNSDARTHLAEAIAGLERIANAAEERVAAMDAHINSAWVASNAREAMHKARLTASASLESRQTEMSAVEKAALYGNARDLYRKDVSAPAALSPGHEHYFDGSGVCACGVYDAVNDLRPTQTVEPKP